MASDTSVKRWPIATVRWWVAMAPLAVMLHALLPEMHRGERIGLLVVTSASVILSTLPWLFPAILARGAVWFSFLAACISVFLSERTEVSSVLQTLLPLAWALLVLGRPDASTRDGAFVPVAFRGTLLAAMLLGAADAYWLGGAAIIFFTGTKSLDPTPVAMALGSAVALASVWGLSRLKLWGVALGLLCNLGVLTFVVHTAMARRGGEVWPIVALLGGGALIHTLLQVPLVLAVVRGRAPAWAQRDLKWFGSAVVLVLTALVIGYMLQR